MKHFILGSIFGAAAGLVFSCMKDDQNNRPGKPLKEEFYAFKHEANNFKQALQKAKVASQELNNQLPQAERTISDLNDDVEKYTRHIQPTVDKIKQKSEQLNHEFDNGNIVE